MEAKDNKRGNHVFISIFLVLLLIFILLVSLFFIKRRTSITPRASYINTSSLTFLDNSFVFASPVRAKAGGDLIRVTIFVLDSEGRGIFDKKVTLGNNNESIIVNDLQSLTDDSGKTIFDVSSVSSGVFYIEASVDGFLLPQTTKVTFD